MKSNMLNFSVFKLIVVLLMFFIISEKNLFANSNNRWIEVKKLTASDENTNYVLGCSVATRDNVAVVGAAGANSVTNNTGAAYIYERNYGGTTNWGQVKKIIASDANLGDSFGRVVDVAGNVVLIGAPNASPVLEREGAAYIFERNVGGTNNWGQVIKLIASDKEAHDEFGCSVAVAGDVVVIGAHGESSGIGAAYIFERNEGGTNNWGQVKKIKASNASAGDAFGNTVAIAGDTIVIGAYYKHSGATHSGSAFIFERNSGGSNNWGQVKELIASDAHQTDAFGWSVAVAGEVIVVGAYHEEYSGDETGAAYIFERNHGGINAWGEVKKLKASDGQSADHFGDSVAITKNGTNYEILVGAPNEDSITNNAGAAYLFGRNYGGVNAWGEMKKIIASDASESDNFGSSVAIDGDVNIIGAPNVDSVAINAGAAYVFERFTPFVDITNQDAKVTYDITHYTIAGTNNVNVTGRMSWSNQLTGVQGFFVSTESWSIANITLDVGTNIIIVLGTNIFGYISSDTVTIIRGGIGTGAPYVDITNQSTAVTYDLLSYTIGGTNNIHVMGVMSWTNSLGGKGTLSVATPWEISGIPLSIGANIITVTGTNVFGNLATDSVTITRGVPGTGVPFVNITNQNITVTYDVSEYTIGGTNNANVVGDMIWSNQLTGITGSFTATANWVAHNIALKVGENAISIYGTNLYGVVSTDSVTITRGIPGTGEPNVDIVNADITVTFDITKYSITGINNTNVVGTITWLNELTSEQGSFPAASPWTIAEINLGVGANTIVVTGTNFYGNISNDSVVITRGVPGTGTPFLDVTNKNAYVTFDGIKYTISGTNNQNVVGIITWLNELTGERGNINASSSWSIGDIGLDIGANRIVVTGTNMYGATSSDNIIITRGVPGTGVPFVDITTENKTETYDVISYTISGTNNQNVVGGMSWLNSLTGNGGTFSATSNWIITDIALKVGENAISIYGTNLYGVISRDDVVIIRGRPGTGVPFINITNESNIVTFDVYENDINGTNNANVVGQMTWLNSLTGNGGALPVTPNWTVTNIALKVGENEITVFGTNLYGATVNDSIIITRGVPGTGAPVVDITNENDTVTYDITRYTIGGTDNTNVVGTMSWSNQLTGISGTLFATPAWTIADVNLDVGANTIIVTGTNLYGEVSSDNITIIRGVPGTGIPIVDITNENITVTFDVSEYTVRGINNTNVVGGMSWSNMFTGMTGTLSASSIWSIEGIALNVGANEIIVVGTNMYGAISSDSFTITRGIPGTGVPVVDITTQDSFVTYDVTKYTIEGQNNTNVVGGMNWSNQLTGVVGTLLATPNWSISNITLSVGNNIIVVVGTNLYGDVSSDSINITRGVPGTGIPFLNITNENATVDFDVYQFTIGVTNNVNVVGTLGWINNIHVTTTNFVELGTNIIINNLKHGDNIISVFGTNIYGFATNDIIEIHRETWGEVHPFIDITNIPSIVPYIQTETDISGTNLNIAGQLAWVNNRKQDITNLFSLGFSTSIDRLVEGNNLIEVFGTNIYGHFTNDFVNIYRETWEEVHPFIDITNTLTTLLYFQTTAEISGTNLNIDSQLTWINNMHSNTATFFSPGFKTTVDNLVEGNNLINVFGKNKYGYLTNDTILISRQFSEEAAPVNVMSSDGEYSDRVQINWNASQGAGKYRVYRNKSALTDGFTLISIELSETNFTDTAVTPGEIYYYRVKAGKDSIWSSFSKCDSGYALFTAKPKIAWKYKDGKKFDVLKGKDITPMLATNLLAGWRIGIATISIDGTLTNFSGPYLLENKKNKNKLWFLKKKKEVIIKYKYNEKKMKDKLLYKIWDQMPNSKVLYLIPANLESNQSSTDIFEGKHLLGIELKETKSEKKKGWRELMPVIIRDE